MLISSEAQGIEWDWFASDLGGSVALLSSGGSGQVPKVLLEHEALIDELFDFIGLCYDEQSWAKAAEFGLFAYDVDINGGPYTRLASPKVPRSVIDLPAPFHALVRLVVVQGHFASLHTIDCEQFAF